MSPKLTRLLPHELKNQFENYYNELDLDEVESILVERTYDNTVCYAAYLYLIAHGKLDLLKKFASQFDTNYTDSEGRNAVLIAVAMGRQDVLDWLLDSGFSLEVQDYTGRDPVLTAVAYGQIELYDQLVKAKKEGGYGQRNDVVDYHGNDVVLHAIANGQIATLQHLTKSKKSLKVKNNNGCAPVMVAVVNGQIETLEILTRSTWKSGYGCSLQEKDIEGNTPVMRAVTNGQLKMLQQLTLARIEGGYGQPLDAKKDGCYSLLQAAKRYGQREVFKWLFTQQFNLSLQQSDYKAAIAWAKKTLDEFNFMQTDLINWLVYRYKELIKDAVDLSDRLQSAETIAKALDELIPSEGLFELAKDCADNKLFVASYRYYLSIYENKQLTEEQRQLAGCELATLLATGVVNLKEDGSLDEYHPNTRYSALEDINKIPINEALQQQVVFAFEYLRENHSSKAAYLRRCFDQILSGDLSRVLHQPVIWTSDAVVMYLEYYSKKNREMLKEDNFIQAQTHVLQQLKKTTAELTDLRKQTQSGNYTSKLYPLLFNHEPTSDIRLKR